MTDNDRKLRLVAPGEPPRLTPGAAKALLRILLNAAEHPSRAKQKERIPK